MVIILIVVIATGLTLIAASFIRPVDKDANLYRALGFLLIASALFYFANSENLHEFIHP